MIVGLLILVALAAVALYSWPKCQAPECLLKVIEVSEWYLYDDGSVSEPVEYCVVSDCDEPVDYSKPEVTDLGEW